jgi:hypothetical protein
MPMGAGCCASTGGSPRLPVSRRRLKLCPRTSDTSRLSARRWSYARPGPSTAFSPCPVTGSRTTTSIDAPPTLMCCTQPWLCGPANSEPLAADGRSILPFPHPGGRAVIDAMEQELALPQALTEPSRATLYRYGNVSSSSVWYELAYAEASPAGVQRGDRVWQLGFGSGFKVKGWPVAGCCWAQGLGLRGC